MVKKLTIMVMVSFLIFSQGGSIMIDYNIQMGQRTADNAEWENHYPITKAENVITSGGNVATDLAAKANTSDVNTQIAAVASGSPKAVFATLTALQTDATANTVDGKKSIYLVTADGNWYYWNGSAWTSGGIYQATGIADKSISSIKTDFIINGKNLFNKDVATVGYVVNELTGAIYANASYVSSDFIEIEPSTEYTENPSGGYYMAFYDENKVYISGQANGHPMTYTSPSNAKYMRNSTRLSKIDSFQIEKGPVSTEYQPFGYVIKDGLYQIVNNATAFATELILPDKIFALVGQELNIYFDNIMNDKDTNYDFDATCDIGAQYENYYRVTPAVAGTYPITINAYKNGSIVATVTSSIIVTAETVGNAVNKKVLVIGDSTTANGTATQKLLDNLGASDVMDITLIGTKGTAPNLHEGLSGWTVNKFYTDPTSPFVFSGAFNFGQYVTTNTLAVPDYVIINLGINDTFGYTDDAILNTQITAMLTQYQGMIDSIHAYNANIKIGLAVTIPPAYDQDSFGKIYGNGQTRWRYKRNNFLWCKALISQFTGKEGQGIYLVPINTNLDTRYNMGLESLPVNARNTKTVESIIANGNVHPAESGYWQIADVYWYWLKSFES